MKHNAQLPSFPKELERPDLYINRELSWIEFNRRVFKEALDARHPLLERIKFVSIFETNLDEFIMIRLAGLKDQVASRKTLRSPDGRTAEQQLNAVRQELAPLVQEVREYWHDNLVPLLAEQHICILDYEQLDEQQRAAMHLVFEKEIFPVLTPLAVDSGHRFPHISNRSLNLAVVIGESFARVKVPSTLSRLLHVPHVPSNMNKDDAQDIVFVWIEQVIAANVHMLFPGFEVRESYPFRVLRDADIELQEDEASDLLEYIEQEVRERRFGAVVDLTINPSMPADIRNLLLNGLEITSQDLTVIDGPLGMGDVMELHSLAQPERKDIPFTPRVPTFLQKGSEDDMFAAIRKRDILLHHPYDSFNSVVEFIQTAANDPQVLTIKQTLYRVGSNSPIVENLLQAVEKDKQVAVLVELKARFDEENNIVWARELEKAGVHVVYGVKGLKTHAKIALIVRKEEEGLRCYLHLGTGNYNATTAKIYEDLCLFTCLPDFGADATTLFNALTGYWWHGFYRKLLVAPAGVRSGIIERIEREISLHQQHGNGHLIFKFNALTDPDIVRLLYRASQAGVSIDLIIRGMCSLRPGVPGISENIRVRSLIGRFLEHSRVYYFSNNGHEELYLGSADLMQRNLDARVETLFPIDAPNLRNAILEHLLIPSLADTANAHELLSDGSYVHIRPAEGEQPFDSQAYFITHPLFSMDNEGNEDDEAASDTTMGSVPLIE